MNVTLSQLEAQSSSLKIASKQVVLGIETSCDETAAAIVVLENDRAVVLSSIVASQIAAHAPYGGVVPEIAARAHVDVIDSVIQAALQEAALDFDALTGIAATAGPGLIGGVMVGLLTGKAIALAANLPLVGVNHLEGHALSPRLDEDVAFPYLLLLVSGGHCQILWVERLGVYRRLGSTIDDAVGEAFDKTAKVLGLGYPGGPRVEEAALRGDPTRFTMPRPLLGRVGCDFSFAGLKTAVARQAEEIGDLTEQDIADLCCAFQASVGDVVLNRVTHAMAMVVAMVDVETDASPRFVVAGGVAANQVLRARLNDLCTQLGWRFFAPALKYCGDNAAMIALAGAHRLALGIHDDLEIAARPRWPLDANAANFAPTHTAGRKGQKA